MAVIDSEIEGPVSGVPVLNAAGDVVTMTVNGVPVRVPATVLDPDTGLPVPMPIHTPTGRISLAQLANATPFPGRKRRTPTGALEDIPGFDAATAIVEGGFEIDPMQPFPNILVATTMEIEPAENLLLGAVTSIAPLRINGVEVREIVDPVGRMAFGGYKNEFGFKVTLIPQLVGTAAAAEGYFAGNFFFAHTVEVDALAPLVAGQPPVSITRARTRRRPGGPATVDIRGGVNFAAIPGISTFTVGINRFDRDLVPVPPVDSNDILIGIVRATRDGAFPNFGLWRLSGPLSQPSEGVAASQPFPPTAPRYIRVYPSLPGVVPGPGNTATEEADVRF